MFEAAKQTKVFQNVVEQIQEAILDGRLTTGQTLPAERELKEMFSISRGTLREALRVLEQKGLIEIRLGVNGGAVVTAEDTTSHILNRFLEPTLGEHGVNICPGSRGLIVVAKDLDTRAADAMTSFVSLFKAIAGHG